MGIPSINSKPSEDEASEGLLIDTKFWITCVYSGLTNLGLAPHLFSPNSLS